MTEERIDAKKTKESIRVKKVSILVFIWSAFLFFLGLQYKFSDEYNILLFWLPILLIIGIILYQIFFLRDNRYTSFVLFEIFLVFLFLHLIYVFGYYGLRGSDPYIDYNFLKEILTNHSFRLEVSFRESVTGYPLIHIFSSIISSIGKINPLLLAKFLPSLISSLIVLPIYTLAHSIHNDKRIALFSCLIFGTIPQFMSFETAFVREVIALFFMILFFYLIYAADKNDKRFYLFVIILIPVVIFAHHLTSLMLLALLIIYLMMNKLLRYFYMTISWINKYLFRKRKIVVRRLSGKLNLRLLLVIWIFSVSLFSYFLYLYGIDFATSFFSDIFRDILGIRHAGGTYAESMNLGAPIVTLKGNIIFYGFFFYTILFSSLLFVTFFIEKVRHKIADLVCRVYYFFCMFLGFLTMFVISNMAFPERFLPFGYMIGLIPLTGLILVSKKKMYKQILVILLVSFIVFNLYNVDTNNYTNNATFTGGATSEKEYLIAQHISFPNEYYGYIAAAGAIFDLQGIDQRLGVRDPIYIKDFQNSSTMAMIKENLYLHDLKNLQQKSPKEYLLILNLFSIKNETNVDKICDLGSIYVIKGGG